MSFQRVYEVEGVQCVAETDKAILCIVPDHGKAWVPRTQIDELSDVQDKDDEGILTVSHWFAEKVGWTS
jgi:hypothetical protein